MDSNFWPDRIEEMCTHTIFLKVIEHDSQIETWLMSHMYVTKWAENRFTRRIFSLWKQVFYSFIYNYSIPVHSIGIQGQFDINAFTNLSHLMLLAICIRRCHMQVFFIIIILFYKILPGITPFSNYTQSFYFPHV